MNCLRGLRREILAVAGVLLAILLIAPPAAGVLDAPAFISEVYDYNGDYGVPVPSNWTVAENATVWDVRYDLCATSTDPDCQGQIFVMTERDDEIKEDRDEMEDLMDEMIDSTGYPYSPSLTGEPVYTEISGHDAIVFNVTYGQSQEYYDRVALIVCEDNDQYWIIHFCVGSDELGEIEPTMNATIAGFEIYKEKDPIASIGDYLPYVIIGIGVCIVAVAYLDWKQSFKKE